MASSWPGAIDTFTDVPYKDNTQYILAAYANQWENALLALQTTIGAGTGHIATNPLWSTTYAKSFSTITARIANVEASAAAGAKIDTSAGDIQPVGQTSAAGNAGLAADAKHAHVGVHSFNGETGDVSLAPTDVLNLFTGIGKLLVGTGNGSGTQLAKGSTGQVLTVIGTGASQLGWTTPGMSSGDLKFTSAFNYDTSNWLLANGASLSRSTYANLFAASTLTWTGTATGTQISGLTAQQTALLAPGMLVEGPGLGTNATIFSVGTTTITVNGAPTAGSGTWTVLPYGQGDLGSWPNNFNVIDMRGRVPVGQGTGTMPSPTARVLGQMFGEDAHQLSIAELPQHRASGSFSTLTETATHLHDFGGNSVIIIAGGIQTLYLTDAGRGTQAVQAVSGTTGTEIGPNPPYFGGHIHTGTFTSDFIGSGNNHNNDQPSTVGFWLVHI